MVGRAPCQVRHDPCPCSGHGQDWVWFWLSAEPCPLQERGSSLLAAGTFSQLQGFFRSLLNPRAKAWEKLISLEVRTVAREVGLLQGTVNCLYKASQCWKNEIYHTGIQAVSLDCQWSEHFPGQMTDPLNPLKQKENSDDANFLSSL